MKTPKKIYLIDLGDEITWCDDPDPTGDIDERDVCEYIRADWVVDRITGMIERTFNTVLPVEIIKERIREAIDLYET